MKRALVTGGTKGIGLGIVRMLLNEGYFVTTTYAHDEVSATAFKEEFSTKSSNFELLKIDQSDKNQT